MERQFLSAFLRLWWLTIDKDAQIAFLIFHEEIEILLVDFSLLQKNETLFKLLRVLPYQLGGIALRLREQILEFLRRGRDRFVLDLIKCRVELRFLRRFLA